MSALFACFLGTRRRRRNSTAGSETSDGSASGSKGGVGAEGSGHLEIVYVELLRCNDQPLGLILEGGTDRGTRVQVAELRPGGVAEQSGALQIGDHIRSINGTVTDHLTNTEASSLLETAGNVVNLEIAFDALPEGSQKLDDGMELKTAFIALSYEEMSGPGFVISGGRLDNRPITVSHVKPGSFPYKKGVLRVGDRILQISGHDMRNASQTDFSNILKQCKDTFTLQIEYDVTTHEGLEETNGPLIVELQKPHGASLGISLSGDQSAGEPIWISRVREAGIADRSGALHVGDHLISVNGQQLEGRSVQEARHILAHSDINVVMEIMPSHNFSERPGGVVEEGFSDTSSRASQSIAAASLKYERKPSRLSLNSLSSSLAQHQLLQTRTHPETMLVKIKSDPIGFGMVLEGGSSDYGHFPIVISSVEAVSPAGNLGQLMVGDRIVAINGQRLLDETIHQAYKLVQEGEDTLTLEVEFDVQDPPRLLSPTNEFTLEQIGNLNLGVTLRGSKEKLWIASLLKGGAAHRKGCFNPGDILVAVNGRSVVGTSPNDVLDLLNNSGDTVSVTTRRETINNFASSRSSPQSKSNDVIYSVQLDRAGQNLGISLQGSERKGQPIIISHIKEGGVAHRTRALRVGDRILAINGESLFSKSLDDAVRILQSAGDVVTLKISKGVVSRRRRNRLGGASGRNYRNPRYRMHKGLYMPRVSSRISQTSDSELSASEYIPETSLDRPLSSNRYASRGGDISRKPNRYNDPLLIGAGLPGRHSPNNRRYSPQSKGRTSPAKERLSPNRERMGSIKNGIPSSLPLGELSGTRRDSFTETTDEETAYEENIVRPRRQHNGYLSYHSTLETSSTDGGNRSEEWNYSSRMARNYNSLGGSGRKKVSDRSSPVGKKSPDGPAAGRDKRLQLQQQQQQSSLMEEAILKQLEDTIFRSKNFVDKLTELANQSGSSDPDSDTEPLKEKLRPHLKQQLLKHVREIMTPQQTELVDVTLFRSSQSAGFGLSLSDGLLEKGVYVNQIQPGGPAEMAGLLPYDRILKFNDSMVRDSDCCMVMPMFTQAGEKVSLTVSRNPFATNNGAAAHSTMSPMLVGGTELGERREDDEYC